MEKMRQGFCLSGYIAFGERTVGGAGGKGGLLGGPGKKGRWDS